MGARIPDTRYRTKSQIENPKSKIPGCRMPILKERRWMGYPCLDQEPNRLPAPLRSWREQNQFHAKPAKFAKDHGGDTLSG